MKTNLKIESIEDKTSKAGRAYKAFHTSEGIMTCFEKKIVAKLEASVGKLIECEVEERNGFKNITGFTGETVTSEKIQDAPKPQPFAEERSGKQASVIISYVKDLVVAGKVDYKDFVNNCVILMELHKELSQM